MAIVLTHYLKPGTILAKEVRDVSGRLLLSKGKKIKPQHLRIFKIWGITEVHVAAEAEAANHNDPSDLDPEVLQEIQEQIAELFAYTDLNHPALKEIYRLAAQFRGRHEVAAKVDMPICLNDDHDSTSCAHREFMPELIRKNITLPEIPNIVFELNEVIANPLSSANDMENRKN